MRVFYFTLLYRYQNADEKIDISSYNRFKFIGALKKSGASILKSISAEQIAAQSTIPILKYYNVFNGDDVEGIDFKLEKLVKPDEKKFEAIEVAEAIVANMPKVPKIKFGGDRAYYTPTYDYVQMPKKVDFENEAKYYSTVFHELVHSTGHSKRVGRDMKANGMKDPRYAYEELIAELGASFLTGESGVLHFHIKNTAAYLKGWKGRLVNRMKEDNRFFFKAASQAQAAADFILDRDENDNPKYRRNTKTPTKTPIKIPKKTTNPPTKKTQTATKNTKKTPKKESEKSDNGQMALFGTSKKGLAGFCAKDPLFKSATNREKPIQTFRLPGEMGKFLEDLQRYRLAILLKGDPHAGKSEFVKQLMDSFITHGFTVALFDLEQGGIYSKDTIQSIDRNISKKNQERLAIAGEAPKGIDTVKAYADKFDVIVIDSFQKLGIPATRFDELRQEYPNTIWVTIFQQNAVGGTRGGVSSDFDTPIIIKVHKVDSTFENNYAEVLKNRGNSVGSKLNILHRKVLG